MNKSLITNIILPFVSFSFLATSAIAAVDTPIGGITTPPAKDSTTWDRGPNKIPMKKCCYTKPVYSSSPWVDYTGDPSGYTVLGCPSGETLRVIFQHGDDKGTQSKKVYQGICFKNVTECQYVRASTTSVTYTYRSPEYPLYFQPVNVTATATCNTSSISP